MVRHGQVPCFCLLLYALLFSNVKSSSLQFFLKPRFNSHFSIYLSVHPPPLYMDPPFSSDSPADAISTSPFPPDPTWRAFLALVTIPIVGW